MDKAAPIKDKMLQEAVESGVSVRIVFANGFQTMAKIVSFDGENIAARVGNQIWTIWTHAISTIVMP